MLHNSAIHVTRIIDQPIRQNRYIVQPVLLRRQVIQPISRPIVNETYVQPLIYKHNLISPRVIEQPIVQQQYREQDEYVQILSQPNVTSTPVAVQPALGAVDVREIKQRLSPTPPVVSSSTGISANATLVSTSTGLA